MPLHESSHFPCRKSRILRFAVYGLFLIFYLWLAAQIPYTDDDWDWGLPVGIQQLVTASLNSRYAGNGLVVLLTRSVFLKTLVMGSAYFLLPLTVSRIFHRHSQEQENRKLFLFLAANVLLLSMERIIWKQTYSWVSGFCNYVIPMIFLSLYLQEMTDLLDRRQKTDSFLYPAALFAMCFVMQLFIENLALFMVILSLYLCLVSWKQYQKIHRNQIVMLAGNLIGLAVMFSSPIYGHLFGGGAAVGGYREIIVTGNSSLAASLYRFIRQLLIYLIPRTWGDNIVISIVLMAIVSWLQIQKFGFQGKTRILVILNSLLAVYFATTHLPIFENTIPAIFLRAIINIFYFLSLSLQLFLLYRDDRKKLHKILLLWLCIPGVILPLTVVSECSHRLFLAPLLFSVILALVMLEDILLQANTSLRKRIIALVLISVVLLAGKYGFVYSSIGRTNRHHLELVQNVKASNSQTLVLPAFVYEDYLWYSISNVAADYRYDFFKEYYGVNPDVQVVIEPVR